MKKKLVLLIVICLNTISLSLWSQTNVGKSIAADFNVSASGGLTYQVPFELPNYVLGHFPDLGLAFNSQAGDGVPGYGWSISGLSSITRIPATKYHDGFIDPVDFDGNDRYALDGQRLIIKSGDYGSSGSTYQTEAYSNFKITAYSSFDDDSLHGPLYFIVHHPNGIRYWYGYTGDSRSSLQWTLSKIEDTQGNVVYLNYGISQGIIRIESVEDPVAKVKVEFNYVTKTNVTPQAIGGEFYRNTNLLTSVDVKVNNTNSYYTYEIEHENTLNGTKRVKEIRQKNRLGESVPSIKFNYASGVALNVTDDTSQYPHELGATSKTNLLSGDFNGDEILDFISFNITRDDNEIWKGINYRYGYKTSSGEEKFGNKSHDVEDFGGNFQNVFVGNYITDNNQVANGQGIILLREQNNKIVFDVCKISRNSIEKQYSVDWNTPPLDTRIPDNASYVTNHEAITASDKASDNIVADKEVNINALLAYSWEEKPVVDYKAKGGLWLKPGFSIRASGNVGFKGIATDVVDKKLPITYTSGDFNGDGITDLLAIVKEGASKATSTKVYLINLNPLNNKGVSYVGSLENDFKDNDNFRDRILAGDYNGDGIPELFHVFNGGLKVYAVNANNTLTRKEHISNSKFDNYNTVGLGDFNGDGKMDIFNSKGKGNKIWDFYISNGKGFQLETKDIGLDYYGNEVTNKLYSNVNISISPSGKRPNSSPNILSNYIHSYIPIDFNKDGKTDIVRHDRITPYYKPVENQNYSHQYIAFYKNTTSDHSVSFAMDGNNFLKQNEGDPAFGHPIFAKFENRNLMHQYAYAETSGNIQVYHIHDNHREQLCVGSIENNGLTTSFEYEGIVDEGVESVYEDYFAKTYEYPYLQVHHVDGFKLVKKVTQQFNSFTREKDYRYSGLISSLDGSGSTGFNFTASTNWHSDDVSWIWTISEYDIEKKGQLIETKNCLSFGGQLIRYRDFAEDILKTSYEYDYAFNNNKTYVSVPVLTTQEDFLKGITTTTNISYDSYYNPLSSTQTYPGGSKTITQTYANNVNGSLGNYYIGRPLSKIETKILGSESFTTREEFTYQNNLLSKLRTQGNGTDWLTEDYIHDSFGNIISKTISGSGITSRVETAIYDSETGRFLISNTDIEGLTTTYEYNKFLGQLTKKTNPFNQDETFVYDAWNRLTSQTDYLGNTITNTYAGISGGGLKRTTISSLGGNSETFGNRAGWVYLSKEKDVLGNWVSKSTEYDAVGKIKRESQPYFGSAASQWTTTHYDEYNRPYQQNTYTGLTINTNYNGLVVTVDDGTKTISTTMDAVGNKVSVTDPGGTINYTYYANNAPKETNYDGHIITTRIDGWGRKIELNDPAAGIYTYSYNILGELLQETTPKGTTTYTLDAVGKPTKKTIVGSLTDYELDYTYHGTNKQISSIVGQDKVNGRTYTYVYTYDSNQRPTKITETMPLATFEKEVAYGSYGKVDWEKYTSTSTSSSETQVTHIGFEYHSISGQLYKTINKATGATLWELNSVNERGQITENKTPFNDVRAVNNYDAYGMPQKLSLENVSTSTNLTEIDFSFDNQRGNLLSRDNKNFSRGEEFFSYDSQDRLINTTGAITHSQTYEANGNIATNSNIGTYSYQTSTKYRVDKIELNNDGKSYYQQHSPQQITYNALKNPLSIYEANNGRVDFEYSPLLGRSIAYYGGLDIDKNQRDYKKIYSAIIPSEIVIDNVNNTTRFINYIGGDAYTASLAHVTQGGAAMMDEYVYLFRDHLGSILGIINEVGTLLEQTHYGAWGEIEEFSNNQGDTEFTYASSLLGRGYTGHEHFVSVGLIHMNGRMYDANLGRFLSPDNFIQDPFNTQSFNRYGYVWNNPLKYVDPSGEGILTAIIIGAIVGAYVGGSVANGDLNPLNWDYGSWKTWTGIVVGGVIGGFAGAAVFKGSLKLVVKGTLHARNGAVITVGEVGITNAGASLVGLGGLIGGYIPFNKTKTKREQNQQQKESKETNSDGVQTPEGQGFMAENNPDAIVPDNDDVINANIPSWLSPVADGLGGGGTGFGRIKGTFRIKSGIDGKWSLKHYESGWRGGSRARIKTFNYKNGLGISKNLGRAGLFMTLTVGVYDVGVNAHNNGWNSLKTYQSVGRLVGGLAGGYLGAEGGALIGSFAGPGGAFVGGVAGGMYLGYKFSGYGERVATKIYYYFNVRD